MDTDEPLHDLADRMGIITGDLPFNPRRPLILPRIVLDLTSEPAAAWMDQAACLGVETSRAIINRCFICPVFDECGRYGRHHRLTGPYAGRLLYQGLLARNDDEVRLAAW